ncbi:MAG TPA: hypothetical protein VN253_03810 [Kofleriaceae bacterium]|nr:hypothetical protein [Kofleriaceae bacterium]
MAEPFLIPDDFRAFMKQVVRRLDAPGAARELLDAEDALRHETGYGGRVDGGDQYRFTYIAADGHHKWEVQLAEAAIRDISDGLLIEVMGERFDLVRTAHREPTGYPLLIWGEYGDDALVARDRAELRHALESLHALAQGAPRMVRMWSASDDQVVAMLSGDDCALYVVESLEGYGTSCGDAAGTDAFELVDPDGLPFAVPRHDCVPWAAARDALLRFALRGDLGPAIRLEGRIPSGLLMMGDVDRKAALAARGEAPETLAGSSLPRMLAQAADFSEETLDEPTGRFTGRPRPAGPPLQAEEMSAWARRLIEVLHARELIELRAASLDEIAAHLGGLLQAHGAEAARSLDAAEWLAGEIGAVRGVHKIFATGGDLQIALRRSRGA